MLITLTITILSLLSTSLAELHHHHHNKFHNARNAAPVEARQWSWSADSAQQNQWQSQWEQQHHQSTPSNVASPAAQPTVPVDVVYETVWQTLYVTAFPSAFPQFTHSALPVQASDTWASTLTTFATSRKSAEQHVHSDVLTSVLESSSSVPDITSSVNKDRSSRASTSSAAEDVPSHAPTLVVSVVDTSSSAIEAATTEVAALPSAASPSVVSALATSSTATPEAETSSIPATTTPHEEVKKHSHSSSTTSVVVKTSSAVKQSSTKQSSTKQSSTKHSSTKQSSTKQSSTKQSSTKQSSTKQSSTKQTAAKPTNNPGSIRIPTPTFSLIHGSAIQSPASQYLAVPESSVTAIKIASNLLSENDPNSNLQNDYDMFPGSGLIQVTSSNEADLRDLATVPWMSRDGGHGGVINGHKIFCFADTNTFTHPTTTKEGDWTGFVSNSIAMDVGNGPFTGNRLTLQDPIGAFGHSNGAQRDFIPFTEGEQAFSVGNGYAKRYAIWPWGSLIPYTNDTSLLYAPLVFQDGSAETKFQGAGVTLAKMSVTNDGQPVLDRAVPYLVPSTESQFGVFGGIRSWGPSGVGGSDGRVYVFATHSKGLILGRVDAQSVDDYSAYEFWDNSATPATWSSTPSTDSYFFQNSISAGDLIYSPYHGTFLLIHQNAYCDSKFFYSYLESPSFIAPSTDADNWEDMVENITKYSWSNPQLLLETPILEEGKYTYDGGVLQGYFEEEDVLNGGSRMLLHWTLPTGKPAASAENGFQFVSAEVRWD